MTPSMRMAKSRDHSPTAGVAGPPDPQPPEKGNGGRHSEKVALADKDPPSRSLGGSFAREPEDGALRHTFSLDPLPSLVTHALTRPRLLRSRRHLSALGDERLVVEAKRGNEAACEAIYDRYHRPLLAFCRHMLGSREDSEDAVQHIFASALPSLQRDDKAIQLRSWLYKIARNRCLSVLRARREYPFEDVEVVSTAGLSEEVERRDELKNLLYDLARLPEKQRAALVLSEVGDLDHSEIAHALDCETKQVKAFIFQARSALIANRHARELPCVEVREQLATATGSSLRRPELRRHLERCPGCTEYAEDVKRQRAMLAVALPVVPSLGLRESVLAAAGIGGGGAAGGGGLIAALGAHGAMKAVAIALATGAAVVGGAASHPALLEQARAVAEHASGGLEELVSSSAPSPEEGGTSDSNVGSFDREAAKAGARRASRGAANGNGSSDPSSQKGSSTSTPGQRRGRPAAPLPQRQGRRRAYGREEGRPGGTRGNRAHGAARSTAAREHSGRRGQRSGRGRGRPFGVPGSGARISPPRAAESPRSGRDRLRQPRRGLARVPVEDG